MRENVNVQIEKMKYSVLMSVYAKDNPEYLSDAINSMLAQTVLPEQFVIVIDGPVPDRLKQIICKYQHDYADLFTILPLKHNGGLGNALNVGLRYCRNELVARMDADDISLPERCKKELEFFINNENLALCGGHIDEFYNNPKKIHSCRKVPTNYEDIKKFTKRRQPFNHPTVMFKKSEVIRCGSYGQLKLKEDYDLFSRMINMGCYALNIDEVLLKYRADENNYKRRKSWSYVKRSINVGLLNYKRKYCSFGDLTYIVCGQIALFLMPLRMMEFVSDRMLRENIKY